MNDRNATRPSIDLRILVALWIVPLIGIGTLVARWSLSGDEYYTYEDSTFSLAKMLSFNSRPLYFVVCHYLLRWFPDWSVEFTIRAPSVLAVSFVAPCLYGMLPSCRFRGMGFWAAIVALCNPWLLGMSQFGRYYGFVVLFATMATVAAIRFLQQRHGAWILVTLVSGLCAAASHPPAVLLIPASLVGWIAAGWWEHPEATLRFVKRFGVWLLALSCAATAGGMYLLQDLLTQWLSARPEDFGGGYDVFSILLSLGIIGGLSSWCIAVLPLLRSLKSWSSQDVFLVTLLLSSITPLLLLTPFGGGVSSRYLLYCLPGMFLLAGQHWDRWNSLLSCWGSKLALGGAILACNIPLLLSVMSDGDHHDFRAMAGTIETLGIHDPIILSSNHRLLDYYLDDRFQVLSRDADDLGEFAEGLPKALLQQTIALAHEQQRTLLLVSRQDRRLLSMADQAWLHERFAVLRTVEKPRYDHRRHRLVLYDYRPMRHCASTGS